MPEEISIPHRIIRPHSQLRDVSDPEWHRRSCGIAALKMVMEFLSPNASFPSLDALIAEGVQKGAYLENKGWSHDGLVALARKYGFSAAGYDWTALSASQAFSYFLRCLSEYPLIASVTKEFSPSKANHLIVVRGIRGNIVSVTDPLRLTDEEMAYTVPLEYFLQHWTRRIIYIAPAGTACPPRFATWLDKTTE